MANGFSESPHETPVHGPKKGGGDGFKADPHEKPPHGPKKGGGDGFAADPHEKPPHSPKHHKKHDGFKASPHEEPTVSPKHHKKHDGFKLSPHEEPTVSPKHHKKADGFKASPHEEPMRSPKHDKKADGFKASPHEEPMRSPKHHGHSDGFSAGGEGHRNPSAVALYFTFKMEGLAESTWTECTGLGGKFDTFEYKELGTNGHVVKLPDTLSYTPLSLTRPINKHSPNLWTWFIKQYWEMTRTTATLTLFYANREPVASWTLKDAWASALKGPTLNVEPTKGEFVAYETLEIEYLGFMEDRVNA